MITIDDSTLQDIDFPKDMLKSRVKTITDTVAKKKAEFVGNNLYNWCLLAYGLEPLPEGVRPVLQETRTTDGNSSVLFLEVEGVVIATLETYSGGLGISEGQFSLHFNETRYYEDWREAQGSPDCDVGPRS